MLESYITPLLMGYVNKYIKNLKPSDLSLSVWGGDVVLQNLELNLDVLQKELNLPVHFLSGRIHELQIHVPWTRITYEPVTITINTIEFVVKLRDPDDHNMETGNDEDQKANAKEYRREMEKSRVAREAEHLSPGYVQGVVNKVINNISVCVNNLILKYVEDDIVFSLNVKSVNLFSANEDWEQAFVEMTLPSLCLRKICSISNLTICLDSRNADGKIDMYQDPILYKCNLSCRVLSKYVGLGSVSAYENQVNVYCESLDLSSTDVQLPMIIRLLKLCLGLYYRTLDLPGCKYKQHPAEELMEHRKHLQHASAERYSAESNEKDSTLNDSSWVSWAWSMIPNLQDAGSQLQSDFIINEDSVLLFGIYITQCSLTLKVTNEAHNSSIVGSKRFEFSPVLNIEMSGCAVEVISKGEEYFDCQLGFCNIAGYMIGECLCKKRESNISGVKLSASLEFDELDREYEDELLFQLGCPKDTAQSGVGFLEDSLFRQSRDNPDDNKDASLYQRTILPEKGKQFTEAKVTKKFSAFFVDYLYIMELPKDDDGEFGENGVGLENMKGNDVVKEVSLKRMIVGDCNVFITSRLCHLITKIKGFCEDDASQRKMKTGIFIDNFAMDQLKLGNFSTRGLHVTFHTIKATVVYPDHVFGKTNGRNGDKELGDQDMFYGILLQIDRVDYQVTSPMFPNELNALLEAESKPKPICYRAAYSDYFLKLFGAQLGVCQLRHEFSEPTILNIVPPIHASIYAKVFIGKSSMDESGKLEFRIKIPSLTVSLTKAQLMMLLKLAKSWMHENPWFFNQMLVDDVFHPKVEESGSNSIVETSIIGIDIKYLQTDLLHAAQGSIGSIKASQHFLLKGVHSEKALMYGPQNTSKLGSVLSFLDEKRIDMEETPNGPLMSFKIQIPIDPMRRNSANVCTVAMIDMKGIAAVLDADLFSWTEYKPSTVPRKRHRTTEKRISKLLSRSFSASTPRKKSYARVLGNSPSKASKEQKASKQNSDLPTTAATAKESLYPMVMSVLKSIILKIDIETSIVFLPVESMSYGPSTSCPEYKIPFAFRTAFMNQHVDPPDTLVIALPNINVSSSNLKVADLSCDIPIQNTGDVPQENSLPWTLSGDGFSVYILSSNAPYGTQDIEKYQIWYPAPWTMFLAAADADPKTPDDPKSPLPFLRGSMTRLGVNTFADTLPFEPSSSSIEYQPSLGFCVHIDLTSVKIGISKIQAEVVIQLISRLMRTYDIITAKNMNEITAHPSKDGKTPIEARSDQSIANFGETDRQSVSSTSTVDQQDGISVSSDVSVFSGENETKSNENVTVSLWLQWIIPKVSVTFYGESSLGKVRPRYKIPCDVEDISLAFDYQQGEIRMKSKVGSIAVKNYFIRPGGSEWEFDKFNGVLLSCDDVFAHNVKASLPMLRKSSPRAFLILNYTRQPLSNGSLRKRYPSVRSEATIPTENAEERHFPNERAAKCLVIEEDVYQHKLEATTESLDVLFSIEPILNIAESFMTLRSPFDTALDTDVKTAAGDEAEGLREGRFQPLPILDLESKGCRIIVPLLDEIKTDESECAENTVIFCVHSVLVKSDPLNRVSSTVLHKDWYRQLRKHQREKNRRTKLWHVQYQVDLHCMSLWTGKWSDMGAMKQTSSDDVTVNAEGQNPALEWNYQMTSYNQPIKLTPLLQDFNCRSTFSPALKIVKKDTKLPLIVCATTVEVNLPQDIAAFCNPFQVNLLMKIAHQTKMSLRNIGDERPMNGSSSTTQVLKSPEVIDSGISSAISLKGTNDMKTVPEPNVQLSEKMQGEHSYSFEFFVSGSKLSLSLYVPQVSNCPELFNGSQIYKLVGYVDIIQPTLDLRDNLLEVTIYDTVIALPGSKESSNSLPDRSLFDTVVLGTLKGKQNKKTGLFASALCIKVSMQEAVKLDVSIDRPLYVNLVLELTAAIDLFISRLAMDMFEQPSSTVIAQDSTQAKVSLVVEEIAVKTCRMNATLLTKFNSHEYKTIANVRSLNFLLIMKDERKLREDDTFSYKCDVDGFEISLSKDDKDCRLISPCIFSFEGETHSIRLLRKPDVCHVQRTIVFVNSGLVHVEIGSLHLEYLAAIVESISESLPKSDNPREDTGVVVHRGTNDLANYVEYSKDDLKTGLFDYVIHSGEEARHPLANQIIFHDEDNGRPPSMTWRYPVPRFLNEVTVMPLPFHVDEVMPGDDLAEIPCVIRYWDHIEQTYVTFRHFFLSQSRSETITLPNPLLDVEGNCQVGSEEWQVVVDVAIESSNEEKSEAGSIPDDILREVTSVYKTPVSATSLAACIKINSCYIPEKIPRIMCSVNVGCIRIVLANHFNTSENIQPRQFAPFFLDSYTYPSNQESCCMELRSFQFKGSLSGSQTFVQSFTTEFDASFDVMNYKDLSWRNCLAIASFAAEVSLNTEKKVENEGLDLTQSKVNLDIDSVKIIASQCIVHTLSMTVENWKQGWDTDLDIPLLNHYIICNETEDVLRFGQVDTDEDIVLSSGQMYPYSWRSPHNQMIHLCVDSIGDWKWSAPFDIDSERGCTRSIKHNTHSSVVHVEIKKIGGIQKQIIFRGGLYFRNCLKIDVEFELFLHHVELLGHLNQQKVTQVPKSFIVPAGATRPSMSFSPCTMTSVYVRLITDALQGPWSSVIPLTIEEEDICVPLSLTIKGETCSIWFTAIHTNNGQFSQLQLCVCPFFIVRSHLPWPVVMKATSRDEGHSSYLRSEGRGKESEVLNLAPEIWYNVNFQIEGTKESTDPPVPINTTFRKILRKKGKIDFQNINYSAEWPYKDGCSIPEEQPPHIIPNRTPKPVPEMPGPDMQCQLLQRWENLPTIVIEIKPKFILNNQSGQNLLVRDANTHLVWGFERDSVITSPAIQTCVQFGRTFNDSPDTQWSPQIYLSELKEACQNHPRDSFCLYQHSSISFSIFGPNQNKCFQFTLASKTRNGIIIVSIRERFCLHNFSGLKLKCFPVLCEDGELEIQGSDCLEIDGSDDPLSICEATLIRKADADNAKEPDLSEFLIRFFFYDSESSPGLLSDHHVFDLSRDHLRENLILRKWDVEPVCIAMTSYMKDGLIHIFIDKEQHPSVFFDNNTEMLFSASVSLSEKENERKSERTGRNDIWDTEIDIGPRQKICYQCKSFRDSFPKIGNVLQGRLSIKARVEDEIIFSRLLHLNDEEKIDEILIGDDKILISCRKAANCFNVLISNEIPDFSPGHRPMNLPVLYGSLNKLDVVFIDDVLCEEVFDMSIDQLIVQHNVCARGLCPGSGRDSQFSLKIGALQVDNQSTDDYDHFPVVVLPLREVSQRYRGESPQNAPFGDTHASVTNALFETIITACKSQHCGSFIDCLKIKAEPLEIYAEDSFIYRLVSLAESFAPPLQSFHRQQLDTREVAARSVGRQILNAINIGTIEVEDLKILLSIHASLKMYLSADHMPVVLGRFNCHPTRTIQKELMRKILYHYLTQALVRAGLMLGSLEILANPTGLIRSVGQGVADFFSLPYDGLTRGPSAFVSGIGSGIGSFFRHASIGALTSITNFASSLSRNMDRLSLDEEHMIRQEEQRCRPSSQVWPGFSNALSGFGISLLGAVAGIIDHPITNVQNAETTQEALKGAARGFGKGLVGAVAKPIGGAMELVSQTGQGILVGTGLTKPPKKLRAALDKKDILKLERESYMKYLWKVIRVEFEEYANLFVITDVNINFASDQSGYEGAVILTPSAFYLYDRDLNNIRMAFACNEITLRLDEGTPYLIYLEKGDRHREAGYCASQMPEVKADESQCNRETSNNSVSPRNAIIDASYPISLQMHPTYAKLLFSQFFYQKDLSEENVNKEALEIASFKQ